MKLKKLNKYAKTYIYLQALWKNQHKNYIQKPAYKKRQATKIKKLKEKYESLNKHYTKGIRKMQKVNTQPKSS